MLRAVGQGGDLSLETPDSSAVTIGSSSVVPLTHVIRHPDVDKTHASISRREGTYYFTSLGKRREARLNGTTLHFGATVELVNGDKLMLVPGDFEYIVQLEQPAELPTAILSMMSPPANFQSLDIHPLLAAEVAVEEFTAAMCRYHQGGEDPLSIVHPESKQPLLNVLALRGAVDAIMALLEEPNPEVTNRAGPTGTPLTAAIQGGHTQTASALIKGGARTDMEDPVTHKTCAYLAAEKGLLSMLRMLIRAKAPPEGVLTANGRTLLHASCFGRAVNTAAYLLNATPARKMMDTRDGDGMHPLEVAVRQDSWEIVSKLIEAGVNVEALTSDGLPPIILGIREKRDDCCCQLIEGGACLFPEGYETLRECVTAQVERTMKKLMAQMAQNAKVDLGA